MVRTFPPIRTRPMSRSDFPAISVIEGQCYHHILTEEEYRKFFLQNDTGGIVAEIDGQVVAYMFFSYKLKYISLLAIAVDPRFRHKSIGTQLVNKLKSKLEPGLYNYIRADVAETNLRTQLFLKKCGFFCTETINKKDDTYYMFQYYV